MKKYCFGIDVGGTTVKMGLFTTEGELLDKWEIPTRKEDGGAYILNDVAASVEAKLAEKNIAKEDVAGAGIGVPGPTLDTGYVSICVNLGGPCEQDLHLGRREPGAPGCPGPDRHL